MYRDISGEEAGRVDWEERGARSCVCTRQDGFCKTAEDLCWRPQISGLVPISGGGCKGTGMSKPGSGQGGRQLYVDQTLNISGKDG